MTLAGRWFRLWLSVFSVLTLAACATRTPVAQAPETLFWSGRLALNMASSPPQSISAGFELTSGPQGSELQLFSPLGSSLATLQWTTGQARLEQGGQVWQDATLDALMVRLTGTALPVAALIDWLQARPTQVEGWSADLSQFDQGKLWIRSTPASSASARPQVDLRLIVER